MYFVYLLKCADTTIYTGITTDVERRFKEHQKGTGGHYTRAHKPIKILYTEEHSNRSGASKREAVIKRLSRADKLKLIKASRVIPRSRRASKKAKDMV